MEAIRNTSNEAIIKSYLGGIDEVYFRIVHYQDMNMMIWYHETCAPVLVQYWDGSIETADGTHLMTVREAMDRYECFRIWNECPGCEDNPTGVCFRVEGPDEYPQICEHNDRPVPM